MNASTSTVDPQELIARLERKYYRKIKEAQDRRFDRRLRRSVREAFNGIEGIRVRRLHFRI